MRYTIVIQSSANNLETALSALSFAQSVVECGHVIERVFFYANGVDYAQAYRQSPADEFAPHTQWKQFIQLHRIDAVVCVGATSRRGMFDAEQAGKVDNTPATIDDAFVVSGLGQLIAACAESDRCITFS